MKAGMLAGSFPLARVRDDSTVFIVAVHGADGLAPRLGDMGLVVGAEISVRQRQRQGRPDIARGETRYALGGGRANTSWVREISAR